MSFPKMRHGDPVAEPQDETPDLWTEGLSLSEVPVDVAQDHTLPACDPSLGLEIVE